MSLAEYFKEWMRVIDLKTLVPILDKLSLEYKRKPICPMQSDVFKAFTVCPYKELKVVMLGQDF